MGAAKVFKTNRLNDLMEKRAQAWGFDVMMASTIFALGLVVFFLYSLNYPRQSEDTINALQFDGNFIAENLLSVGSPNNWDQNNVASIGLTNENKINQTKLERMYDMTNFVNNNAGYNRTKSLLNTRYDFFFNFTQQISIRGVPLQGGIGRNYTGDPNKIPKNLIKVTRLTVYNNQPTTMQLFVWE